jgi:hypothetical protein
LCHAFGFSTLGELHLESPFLVEQHCERVEFGVDYFGGHLMECLHKQYTYLQKVEGLKLGE